MSVFGRAVLCFHLEAVRGGHVLSLYKRREFLPHSQDGRLILASHGHDMSLHVSAHACSLIHMCISQDKQYSIEACFCSLAGHGHPCLLMVTSQHPWTVELFMVSIMIRYLKMCIVC